MSTGEQTHVIFELTSIGLEDCSEDSSPPPNLGVTGGAARRNEYGVGEPPDFLMRTSSPIPERPTSASKRIR